MAGRIQVPFILSPELSESFVMFICSGAIANNCRSHANSQSARLETASAKLLSGKYSVFYLFLQKWFCKQIAVFPLLHYIFILLEKVYLEENI